MARHVDPAKVAVVGAIVLEELLAGQGADAVATWASLARPEQLPPATPCRTWLILAGRGWGKTRTGAETIAGWVRDGTARRIAVVARTEAELRDVVIPALRRAAGPGVEYIASRNLVRWPNGVEAIGFSAEDPESLRGYEFDTAWCDEVAAWRYPEAFDQLQFCLRIGLARQIVTTTPQPVRAIRQLLADPRTVVTRGRTLDNAANLSEGALQHLIARYEGTRLGRQELEAELLDDVPGALWTRAELDEHRRSAAPDLVRIVVAIDPAVTSEETADETGILVVGKGIDGHGYVLADLSGRYTPDGWARRAVDALRGSEADRIVAEVNQGGDLVEATIRSIDPLVPYRAVRASRGRRTRAEPIAALYEQGRVHHVGVFAELEDQLCSALPEGGTGPDDRLDALVWALTELDLAGNGWDVPGAEDFARNVWRCRTCSHPFYWAAGRPCDLCRTPAPPTYDEPVPPPLIDPDVSGSDPAAPPFLGPAERHPRAG